MPEKETIIVIGAGVIGLSTALTIQQHLRPSQSILLVAKDFPNTTSINYTSPWAGAHYRPVLGTTPQLRREASQARRTHAFFKTLASSDPAAGVQSIDGVEYLEAPGPEYSDPECVREGYGHMDGFRILQGNELPDGAKWGARYRTFVVNPPVYCAYMLRRFALNGGRVREYALADLGEAFYLAGEGIKVKTVVNCSGMGFKDEKSFIIRGQTVLVRNPCPVTLTKQNHDGTWSFSVPRPLDGGTIIGGTKQPHNWDPNPSPEVRAQLLANAAKWFPFTPESKGRFDVIRDIVGRRPAREGGVRIEAEEIGEGRVVVHGYGVAGRGFELSRGVAEDVVGVMLERGLLTQKALL